MSCNNWFVVKHDTVPVATMRGTRPGSSFADVVFALLGLSVQPRLPWDDRVCLSECSAEDGEISVDDIVWADDLAVPRLCPDPRKLRAAIACEAGLLTDAMGEFGMRLTFGAGKTAAIASVRGAGARSVQRQLFGHDQCAGVVPLLREYGPSAKIPLVPAYRHLRVMQAPFGVMGPELRHRISQAHGAFQEGRRKLYKNRAICVKRKALLLNATVIAKLLQGAGAWPPLNKKEQQMLDTAIWTSVGPSFASPARVSRIFLGSPVAHSPAFLPPDVMLQRARLLYLRQLVANAPFALWAVVRADRPYAELLWRDITWLYQWNHRLMSLGHPRLAWDDWARLMVDRPGVFKGAVRRACTLELVRVSLIAALDGLFRGLVHLVGVRKPTNVGGGLVEFSDLCLICKRAFRSRVAWSGHAARLHGYRSKSYLVGKGKVCLTCGKLFSTVGRLRRHLTSVPACLTNWGSFRPHNVPEASMHPQAPPILVEGSFVRPTQSDPLSHVSSLLLSDLRSLSGDLPVAEDVVWSCVQEHVEPLSVLRATVEMWQTEAAVYPWTREVSENILLLLDPSVSADVFPEERGDVRAPPFAAPTLRGSASRVSVPAPQPKARVPRLGAVPSIPKAKPQAMRPQRAEVRPAVKRPAEPAEPPWREVAEATQPSPPPSISQAAQLRRSGPASSSMEPRGRPFKGGGKGQGGLYSDKVVEKKRAYEWSHEPQVKKVLPIQEKRDEVMPVLCGASLVVCLVGETGSGKSTQVPQMILEEARQRGSHCFDFDTVRTQPRRVAALNLAHRVASELGEQLGDSVGYRIGGDSSRGKYIDFCTVGYILQLFLNAPEDPAAFLQLFIPELRNACRLQEFGEYTHIVLDEVHERSAESDMLCLVVRLLAKHRFEGTRLVIMSATLQSDLFAHYFGDICKYPVGRVHDMFGDGREKKAKRIDQRHCDKLHPIILELLEVIAKPASTILVFLPGIAEISSLWQEAKFLEESSAFKIFPLHSMVPREEQEPRVVFVAV
eukprot:s5347_g3.t1